MSTVGMDNQSPRPRDDKPKNPHYQSDIHYALDMCRWYMRPMGLWCMVYDTSSWEKIASAFLILWYTSITMFCTIPPIIYIYSETKLLAKMKIAGMVSTCITTAIKFFYFCLKRKPLRNCIMQVEKDWKAVQDPGYRATMLRQVSINRHLITISAIMFYSSGIFLHVVVPIIAKLTVQVNATIKPAALLGYDFLLDSEFSHAQDCILTVQLIAGLVKYTVTTCVYGLSTTFVTHITGQLQIQISRLGDYVTDLQVKRRDPLGSIIQDHVAVLRLSSDIQESMSEIYLIQIAEATLLICLLAYYSLVEWGQSDAIGMITLVGMLMSYIFNIFTFCYVGEILTEQFSKIGPAAYNIEWYNLSPRQAYNLIMVCAISHDPPNLTAGNMFALSMKTFSSVMQSAVVYMNLIREMSDW